MTALVKEFNSSEDKITIKPNTIEWADFYQRLPAATKAGNSSRPSPSTTCARPGAARPVGSMAAMQASAMLRSTNLPSGWRRLR